MPGTIRVSILELKGLPLSSASSSASLKISIGKQEYETQQEKGDFSFSLTTLRDNLVLRILDSEGNEIAHTGLESRLIAEKGFWDDMFPLNGGGQVHMRLVFTLSEEEQNRIRSMRESALRKKREELIHKTHTHSEMKVASSGGKNYAGKKEGFSSPTVSMETSSSNLLQGDDTSEVPNTKPSSEVNKSFTSIPPHKDDHIQPHSLRVQSQSPSEQTSSRVRNMIRVFDSSSLRQESTSHANPTTSKPHPRASILPSSENDFSQASRPVESKLTRLPSPTITNELLEHPSTREMKGPGVINNSSNKLYLGRSSDLTPGKSWNSCSMAGQECSSDISAVTENLSGKNPILLPDTTKHGESNGKEHCSPVGSCGWIFLEEERRSCIASPSNMVVDPFGESLCNENSEYYQKKDSKDENQSRGGKQPAESESSSENGASKGPIGQVMKIVIMVGFGLLVLLTRQRKSR